MNDCNSGHGSFIATGLPKDFNEIPFPLHPITWVLWARLIFEPVMSERFHRVSPACWPRRIDSSWPGRCAGGAGAAYTQNPSKQELCQA
jgi:hypothetical protein